MPGRIAPNRPRHLGTVVARTVGTVAISCNGYWCLDMFTVLGILVLR